jgi:hypothetical protein
MTTLDTTALEAATAEWLNWTDRTAGEGLAEHLARSITAYLDALSSIPEQGVGVKPLRWQRSNVADRWTAWHPWGEYEIVRDQLDQKYRSPQFNAAGAYWNDLDQVQREIGEAHEKRVASILSALAPSQPAAVGEGENAFAGYEGVTAKELAETVARYGKALSQIDRSWAAAVSGASTDIPNITGWTGSLDNYGQIFAWVARAALRSTP